jgi:hypothetical protein
MVADIVCAPLLLSSTPQIVVCVSIVADLADTTHIVLFLLFVTTRCLHLDI